MNSPDTRTFRCARGTLVMMGVAAAGPAVFTALALVMALRAGSPTNLLVLGLGTAWFLFSGLHFAALMRMQVQLGYDWIETRTLWMRRRAAFAEITAFSELRGSRSRGVHISLFRLHREAAPPLTFTSQLVGWAAVIDALHHSIPWHVPAPSRVHARQRTHPWRFDPFSAASVAPGQPIPEEWAHPARVRWGDVLVAAVVSLVVCVAAALGLLRIAQFFVGHHLALDVAAALLAIVASQAGIVVLTGLIRGYRLRRAEHERLVRRFEGEGEDPGIDPRPPAPPDTSRKR
jgi:hypothetical protein